MTKNMLQIGPIAYKIKEVEGLHDDGSKLSGHIRYNSCEILLEASQAPQSKRQTLWHKIIHGILFQGGMREHAERGVEVLANGIMAVLQANPWLGQEEKVSKEKPNEG